VVQLVAGLLVLLISLAIAAAIVFCVYVCMCALRRRHDRRMWDDLVARHRELDRELDNIWPL
jgi:hypothetical protein